MLGTSHVRFVLVAEMTIVSPNERRPVSHVESIAAHLDLVVPFRDVNPCRQTHARRDQHADDRHLRHAVIAIGGIDAAHLPISRMASSIVVAHLNNVRSGLRGATGARLFVNQSSRTPRDATARNSDRNCRQLIDQLDHPPGAEPDDPIGFGFHPPDKCRVVDASLMRFRRQTPNACSDYAVHQLPKRVADTMLIRNV
jgi:hypothetical protein